MYIYIIYLYILYIYYVICIILYSISICVCIYMYIFAIQISGRMQEEYHAKGKKLYMCFVYLEKDLDRVPRKVLEWGGRYCHRICQIGCVK